MVRARLAAFGIIQTTLTDTMPISIPILPAFERA
ncbi:hypothetical protein SBC1_36360 [Caballeronia sp. SBC1]|nr:hypothetical protein SBC1_36360 [Caballeronia sp. SBC1]